MAAAGPILEEVEVQPLKPTSHSRHSGHECEVNPVGDDDHPDLGDVEPFLAHITKDLVNNDFDGGFDVIHETITEIELNESPPGRS
ncbi:hypothetical protein E4U52_001268 [Claviceps spartinae]|nr:hypothetical protein E4U52_001268 [Claviceps spartinae]